MARLALAGGAPVRTAPFPPWPDFDERERALLLEALEAGAAFAAAHDARHAFAVVNGTVARGRGPCCPSTSPCAWPTWTRSARSREGTT